jgi:hypothetical protein
MDRFLLILFSILFCVLAIVYFNDLKMTLTLLVSRVVANLIDSSIVESKVENNILGGCYEESKYDTNYIVDVLNVYNCLDNYIRFYNSKLKLGKLKYKPVELYKILFDAILKSTTGHIYLVAKDDGNNLRAIVDKLFKSSNDINRNRVTYYNVSYTEESHKELIDAREKYQSLLATYNNDSYHKLVINDYYKQHGLGEIDDNFILYLSITTTNTKILSNDNYSEMTITPNKKKFGVRLLGNFLPSNYYYYSITSNDDLKSFIIPNLMNVKEFKDRVVERAKNKIYQIYLKFNYDDSSKEICLVQDKSEEKLLELTQNANIVLVEETEALDNAITDLKNIYLLYHIYLNKSPKPSDNDILTLTTVKCLIMRLNIRNSDALEYILSSNVDIVKISSDNLSTRLTQPDDIDMHLTKVLSQALQKQISFINRILLSIKWLKTYNNAEDFDRLSFVDKIIYPPPPKIKKSI